MAVSDRLPVSVAQNRWSDLAVPDLGGWEPKLRVSVIVPYYQRSPELTLTLAGLAEQTYPADLFEVIVVDDGSPTDPPRPPDGLPFRWTVLRQEDRGYGLARARNFGAREAAGDVLVFLDCDMIPERQHLEAHVRWHHAASCLVTVGSRRHADFAGVTTDRVAAAVRTGTIGDLVSAGGVSRPEWIEAYLGRTNDLLGPFDDFYAVMSGGNLGIDRDLYLEAGGTDESFTRWGGEDNEFGYRVIQLGALVVPERLAMAWHQGEGHEPTEEDRAALRLQRPRLQNLIPHRWTRIPSPGRIYERPYLTVHIMPGSQPGEVVGIAIDSLLAGDFTDLVIGVGEMATADETGWLSDTYGVDPRVILQVDQAEMEKRFPFSPVRMALPAGFGMRANSLQLLMDQMGAQGVGLLQFTLPGHSPATAHGRVSLTRAENRVRRIEGSGDETLGALFGEKWISGSSVGFWKVDDLESARARIRVRVNAPLDQAGELAAALEVINNLSNRRSIRLADGLGSLWRARSGADLRTAFSSIGRALSRADRGERPAGGG